VNLSTPRSTLVAGTILLIVLALAGWFLAVGPKTAALAEVHTGIQETRDQNALLEQQLAVLR
jgi:type II secretory pathway component PulM